MLVAQTIAQFRTDAHADDAILTSLSAVLNGPQRPDFLDEIRVTDLTLGEEFPIFSNCRVSPIEEDDNGGSAGGADAGAGGRLQACMDVDLSDDSITLGLETKILLNYPKPRTAVLPVALAVSVVRFSGTLSISFLPSSSSSQTPPARDGDNNTTSATGGSPTTLSFTFLPNYTLDLSVRSLVGSRSRLQDVPKIAQVVESRLHAWFDERCVEPRVQQIVLPSLWPRKQNTGTRGGGDGVDEEGDGLGYGFDGEGRGSVRQRQRQMQMGEEGLRWRNGREMGAGRVGGELGGGRGYDLPAMLAA